jgi:signal transduction histidine kinase
VGVRMARVEHARAAGAVRWLLRDLTERRRGEEQARRLVHEQSLRRAAQEAERTARFLDEVSRTLIDILESRETLGVVARQAADFIAPICIIDVLRGGAHAQRFAAHAAPAPAAWPQVEALSPRLDGMSDHARAVRTGEVQVASRAQAEGELGLDEAQRAAFWACGVRSYIIVPLPGPRGVAGLLTIAGPDNVGQLTTLARELAQRLGGALEQARLYAELEAANQAKVNFIHVLSHEFRTPLSAIIGYAQLLQGRASQAGDPQETQIQRIAESAWHLSGLVDEILKFARADAGDDRACVEPCDLAALVHSTTEIVAPLAAGRHLFLDVSVEEGDWIVSTDPGKVRQILFNLLSNAIKFTEHGGVTLRLSQSREMLRLEVEDTGPGIAEANLEHIFDPFWRGRNRAGGAGLGLSVTRQLVRLLGGSVEVRSEPGEGSIFTVVLPLVRDPSPIWR